MWRALVILTAMLAGSRASADLVTITAVGEVVEVIDNINVIPSVQIGDLVGAGVFYDSSLIDLNPEIDLGEYVDGGGGIVGLTESELTFSCFDSVGILVVNDDPVLFDSIVYVGVGCDYSVFTVNDSVSLAFIDSTKTVLSDDSLLSQPPKIEDFDIALLLIEGCSINNPECDPGTEGYQITGLINFVPEPPRPLLAVAALLTLGALSRRRRH